MAPEDGEGETPVGGSAPEAGVAAGRRAGKPLSHIAAELYGRERVDAGWDAGGGMRSKLRLLFRHAMRQGGR